MRVLRIVIILALIAAAPLLPLVLAQSSGTASQQPNGGATDNARHNLLRIVAPDNWEMIHRKEITVKYELVNTATTSDSPNFRLQLDERTPVFTAVTEYTFTGLELGGHRISVDQVDASNTPLPGTHSEIHFYVGLPQHGGMRGSAVASADKSSDLKRASFSPDKDELPSASSALPLLSVIGFGALVGGIASAMNTR